MRTDAKKSKSSKRNRYWSVMLVGDQGKVIPFRHLKALILSVGIALSLCLILLAVLGGACFQQYQTIRGLKSDLDEAKSQTARMRDEKDLYMTELIALKKQTGKLPPPPIKTIAAHEEPSADNNAAPQKETPAAKPEQKTAKSSAPQIKWSADIRKFEIAYDHRQQILNARFRIYNTSEPKKRLSGHTVAIFKKMGDPPAEWQAVPSVPLSDGQPDGKVGKRFSINNYFTEQFKVLHQNKTADYNSLVIYVFTEQGTLITSKEIPFNVDYSPPAAPKPKQPRSAPADPGARNPPASSHPEPVHPHALDNETPPAMAPAPAPEAVETQIQEGGDNQQDTSVIQASPLPDGAKQTPPDGTKEAPPDGTKEAPPDGAKETPPDGAKETPRAGAPTAAEGGDQ